jgi:hypothetical protein
MERETTRGELLFIGSKLSTAVLKLELLLMNVLSIVIPDYNCY